MWQWRVTGLWRTSVSPQDKQRMYLLSEPHGGRRPTTSTGLETLEIMCNLILAQNKRRRRMDRRGSATKETRRMDGLSWTALSPKGSWAFSSQATQSHRAVPDSTHSSDTCINGILAWDCRCWKAIVQKQLCLSYSLFLSLSYFTSVSFTDSSILSQPFSIHPSPPSTYTHLLYSLSIRSVITGQCQHLKTVVLAEPVSSQVELTIFPVPDCKKPDSFQRSYTLHQDPLTERKPTGFY